MSEKMCACKACGQQIAKKAKTCPHCGAKNKKGHPILVGVLIAVALIAIIGAMGGDDAPTGVEGNHSPEEKTVFSVGETAQRNEITVSMVNVTESTGSAYNTPTEGNVFVLCEFEIANDSDKEISVSSMMSFEAYCDDYTCTYSLAALLEKGNKNQLDGTVAPGKRFNGLIGYEVPADWQELEVHFTPDFWSGKDIVFVATSD